MHAHYTASKGNHSSRVVVGSFVTVAAALVAWVLASVTAMSEQSIVVTVMVIAFAASWIVTGQAPASNHRVTLVRARSRLR